MQARLDSQSTSAPYFYVMSYGTSTKYLYHTLLREKSLMSGVAFQCSNNTLSLVPSGSSNYLSLGWTTSGLGNGSAWAQIGPSLHSILWVKWRALIFQKARPLSSWGRTLSEPDYHFFLVFFLIFKLFYNRNLILHSLLIIISLLFYFYVEIGCKEFNKLLFLFSYNNNTTYNNLTKLTIK